MKAKNLYTHTPTHKYTLNTSTNDNEICKKKKINIADVGG